MAKQPFISHVVNGYSRYDVPESKAFSCTPGILYPARIDFINARDRVRISQGIDVRSNPLIVPSFNPYTVRLHRFWVPLQLYHPELRTNSSKFDMNDLSLNWCRNFFDGTTSTGLGSQSGAAYPNSLMFWLRTANRRVENRDSTTVYSGVSLPSNAVSSEYFNADTYLAYWDIVRNYYSFSQWGLYSFAWPSSWKIVGTAQPSASDPVGSYSTSPDYASDSTYFYQCYGNLEFLDAYYESQFYPSSVASSNNTFNRGNLFSQIIFSDVDSSGSAASDGYPVSSRFPTTGALWTAAPSTQTSTTPGGTLTASSAALFLQAHPMAVVPSSPDRFSRMLPPNSSDTNVSISGVQTIPQLAIASRLQEYRDLLGAGGSRYSDWLETFFAAKIDHVDRPKLLFSASQTVNVQVIMNQSGNESSNGTLGGSLGQMAGSISFNTALGRSQSYYFNEPGYLIDMISIRPVYYWSQVRPDYLDYHGADYFNPVYNDIGYQDVPAFRFLRNDAITPTLSFANEPCFNEFRSSYDEVLGLLSDASSTSTSPTIYSSWVQQRSQSSVNVATSDSFIYPQFLFVDMNSVNNSFASNVEDNFFVNLSYSVQKKNLINKTFATRLSNR